MPDTYLDSLRDKFDRLTTEIEDTLARALEENREITDDEKASIDRIEVRRSQLEKDIDHAAALASRREKVAQTVSKLPTTHTADRAQSGAPREPEFDLARELGGDTPGHYAALIHRAWVKKDRAAIDLLERATAHQTLDDNPGLVPYPLVGPMVDRLREKRPFIASVGVKDAPAPKFDRPLVTQHVDVDVQDFEKNQTASQKMLVGVKPVTLATFAGHLNLSKQDIRWAQPSLLNIVYQSFGKTYARRTDKAAAADFVDAVTQTATITTLGPSDIDTVIGAAGATIAGADDDNGELTRAWMSRDVAVKFAKLRDAMDQKLYNIPLVGGQTGDIDGLPVSIAGRLPAGTLILGDDTLVEYWEDLEGFLQVDEPDVLGQMVGYAGYGSLCVVDPTGFVKVTVP